MISMSSILLLTGCGVISQRAGSIPFESVVFALEPQLLLVSSTQAVQQHFPSLRVRLTISTSN